jgi:hypothetical protein
MELYTDHVMPPSVSVYLLNYPRMIPHPTYSKELETFSEVYLLLGAIELELRLRIPSTLSSGNCTIRWFEHFEFDTYPNYLLFNALKRANGNPVGIESKLPFGFWVRLFRIKNFEMIWKGKMSEVFPQLPKPDSKKSYQSLSRRLYRVHKLRNKIAHYGLIKLKRQSQDIQDLIFLIRVLGIEI